MKNSAMKWMLPLSMLLMLVGCEKCIVNPPTVTTSAISASSVTPTSAVVGGEVTSDGGAAVTDRGVCWNTSSGPTIANNPTPGGSGIGIFIITLTGLSPGATYYLKAYATNSEGTVYGSEVTFSTSANPSSVTTTPATAITTTTATSGGTINSDGGGAISAKGVCWSTTSGPTIALTTKTTDGTGSATFTSNIGGLAPGTKYYVKAYATNSAGTSYGNEVSFTTSANPPTVTTTSATAITATTATSGGNVTADGGGTVTAKGVCWSTTSGPIISNTKTSDGTGIGIFNSSLTSLAANTTYYVRAYATNSAGTAYGNEISFKTSANSPIVTTTAASLVTSTTASSGGNVTSDGGSAVTARGVCWGTTTSPTITNSKTSNGTGTGSFTSSLTSLLPGTSYYLRAYATNSAGTGYGNEVTFTTTSPSGTVTDIEGNVYKYVTIGTQVWMAENLRTSKYRNGELIGTTEADISLQNNPKYCWIYGDVSTYGRLYTWYAATDSRGLCPTGWHLPTDTEWLILSSFLGGENIAGGKLKEVGTSHWLSPNFGATNESGFTALPSGYRMYDGRYYYLGRYTWWWAATSNSNINADNRGVSCVESLFYKSADGFMKYGWSVRCLKD